MSVERRSQPLLHNMSMRPRTTVQAAVAVVGKALARFAVDPERDRELIADPDLVERLERTWSELQLRGALHVYPLASTAAPGGLPVVAAGPLLALNVLGRARGGLLLPRAPLELDPRLIQRELASDDPRLVQLASTKATA